MINLSTGEISFQDGLLFSPHCKVPQARYDVRGGLFGMGWARYNYGERISEYGMMDVGAVCDESLSVQMVIMSHQGPGYEQASEGDPERNAFHEYIVSKDLLGQREFSWGVIRVSTDPKNNKNWLAVVYTPGANVPKREATALLELFEHAKLD